jgi:hypothetical protein
MIEVERLDASGLKRQVWRFELLSRISDNIHEIYLDTYSAQTRITKRCGWLIDVGSVNGMNKKMQYCRLFTRESGLPIDQVPLPDDVAAEAKKIVVDGLTVKKWEDRKNG